MPSAEKLLMEKKIGEVINTRLIQAPSSTSVRDAVLLMQKTESAYLILADGKKPVGIFTESDLTQKILGRDVDWNAPVREFMTKEPVALRLDDTVGRAIDRMAELSFAHIPLVDERQRLVGSLSVRTLIRFLAEFYPAEIYNLPPDIHQVHDTAEGG